MASLKDLVGTKYGKLTVVAPAGRSTHKRPKPLWLCRCDCGNEKLVLGEGLKSGHNKSCGCAAGNYKHGHSVGRYNGGSESPTKQTYNSMVARCTYQRHRAYPRYGGRGITVCARWLAGFENFLADMGERPDGHTLDRIDNSAGYNTDNCRWATPRQQYENKRVVRDANGKFTKEK